MRGNESTTGDVTLSSTKVKNEFTVEAEPTVTIVIPARNEAANLEIMLPRLPKVHQVILVDANSTDGTVERSQALMPDIEVIYQTRRGKGNALACGFERATGDIIVMFDADGSADPDEIPIFVSALKAGADFAKGSRFAVGGGSSDITHLRRAGNWGLNVFYNMLFGTRYSDLCYGYNAFWRRILPELGLPHSTLTALATGRMHWGDGFEIEAIINSRVARNRFKIAEVASFEHERIHGESNLNTWRDGWRVLNALIKERTARRIVLATDPTTGITDAVVEMVNPETVTYATVAIAPATQHDIVKG